MITVDTHLLHDSGDSCLQVFKLLRGFQEQQVHWVAIGLPNVQSGEELDVSQCGEDGPSLHGRKHKVSMPAKHVKCRQEHTGTHLLLGAPLRNDTTAQFDGGLDCPACTVLQENEQGVLYGHKGQAGKN